MAQGIGKLFCLRNRSVVVISLVEVIPLKWRWQGLNMAIILSDKDITRLINEKKPLPSDFWSKIQTRPKSGHKERELDIKGAEGSDFRLILRQSDFNPLDFSVILAYRPPKSNLLFRLRRYNGKSNEHTNPIEGDTFYDFHVHETTERYQEIGAREDTYAKATDRFADFQQAISCMLKDCGFEVAENPQGRLFEEI